MNEREKIGKIAGRIGIAANIVLATAKVLVGVFTGAVSVIADGVNNYADAVSSIVSYIGFHLAARPADDDHPFGHARYEYISGLVVAFLVMIAGVDLLQTGVEKILEPQAVTYSPALFAVLIASILAKAGLAVFNFAQGRRISSTVLIATAQDSRNDVIATTVVLLSALVGRLTGWHVDGYMSVGVALFILYSGIMLVKDATRPLLGTAPDEEFVRHIEAKIMSHPEVLGTHDLMVHEYGPDRFFASAHVEMAAEADVLECHELIDSIEQAFHEEDHIHMVLHYDPIVTADDRVGSIRGYLAEQVKTIDPAITIHDLRIVPGAKNTNVIFDCVVPRGFPVSESAMKAKITELLHAEYPNTTPVIKFEHSFVSLDRD